jgi:uncharacterized membrane protein YqjE
VSDSPSSLPGILNSLRQFADGLLGSVYDRLELFSIELQEEKLRIFRILILINAAIFSAFLALIFISLVIVYLFWDTARLGVLSGFAVFYSAAFAVVVVALKKFLASQPKPFEITRQELAADRDALDPRA